MITIVVLSGVLALIAVSWAYTMVRDSLDAPMGPASWDISKSWTTNLTVIGALVTAALGSSMLFAKDWAPIHMAKSGYVGLSLFFAILVVAAPMAYLVRQPGNNDNPDAGSVVPYIVSNGLTLWAVLGQIGTLILFLDEVRVGGHPLWIFYGAQLLLAAIGLADLLYAKNRIIASVGKAKAFARPDIGIIDPAIAEGLSGITAHVSAIRTQLKQPDATPVAAASKPGWSLL